MPKPIAVVKKAGAPVTPRPRGRPRKQPLSSPYIDDQAEESDDGVLVPSQAPVPDPDSEEDELTGDVDGYEMDFINDGDPDDGKSDTSGYITPPLKAVSAKSVSSKSPKKSPGKANIIEIGTTSEEDIEAMDIDDSMFKKPASVKRPALPPSLTTRSAAKRKSDADVKPQPSNKKTKAEATASSPAKAATPAFVVNENMNTALTAWMMDFMQKMKPQLEASTTPSPSPVKPKKIDFDAIELEKGIKASKKEDKALRASNVKGKTKPVDTTRYSPEWPSSGEDLPAPIALITRSTKVKAKNLPSQRSIVEDVISHMSGEDMDPALRKDESVKVSRPISTFMIKSKDNPADKPAAPAGTAPLTMEDVFGTDDVDAVDDKLGKTGNVEDTESRSTVFLEDLETYKSFYDAEAPCGVFDPDLQDPALAPYYVGNPPLPGGRQILPAFDPKRLNGVEEEDTTLKGGRVKFGSWKNHAKRMLAENSVGAMVFVEAAPNFINPSKVSPVRLSSQLVTTGSGNRRLCVDNRVAIYSVVVTPGKLGGTDRLRKWISGVFHNQDWERFEALSCLVFGQQILYAQITPKKALSFQTMMSPSNLESARETDARFAKGAPSDMFSPVVSSSPSKSPRKAGKPAFKSKTLLGYNDPVPVYDARKTVIDFKVDLDRLDKRLPLFVGEIPFGSFVVVGYTCSTYSAAINGSPEKVANIGFNVVWAILCGTPTR
ncbi:hypothetical protein C8J57DRAFT_1247717 [Mycena rebaudengoi]|nr:hypothetical protein C8J57DRAFT_1247717 [Mycena rebaudengoi]